MLVRLKYACFYFHIVCLKGCAMLYLPECAVLGKIQHTEVDTALLAETTSRCAAFHFTLTEMAKECCCLLHITFDVIFQDLLLMHSLAIV